MTKLNIEITTVVSVDPVEERERFALHFNGVELERLNQLVSFFEDGNFYEAGKLFWTQMSPEEREALDTPMFLICENVVKREHNSILWNERLPGVEMLASDFGDTIHAGIIGYPKYELLPATPDPSFESSGPL